MKLIDLKEKDKGRKVVYKTDSIYEKEVGVITSWNSSFVFVRYGSDTQSKATYTDNLVFENL